MGPDSKQQAFDPIVDHGAGQMPGLAYNFKSHSNSLVPLFTKGVGSEAFTGWVVGTDPVRGPYVTNTAVAEVMRQAFTGKKPARCPEDQDQLRGPQRRPRSQRTRRLRNSLQFARLRRIIARKIIDHAAVRGRPHRFDQSLEPWISFEFGREAVVVLFFAQASESPSRPPR